MDNKKDPNQELKININLDTTPILYSDNIFVSAGDNGVVIDFAQKLGPTSDVRIVSRIGMSREHAKKFYKILGDQLKLTESSGLKS